MQENTAAEDAQAFGTSPDDPVFATEQAHLSEVYAELEKMRGELVRKMEATSAAPRAISSICFPKFRTTSRAIPKRAKPMRRTAP